MLVLVLLALLSLFAFSSVTYVYRFRGSVRYPSLSAYLRKSWPVFAPLNCLLYLSTRKAARRAVLHSDTFPGLQLLREHWLTIRDEAMVLHARQSFEATRAAGSPGYYDVGFRTFYKQGWSKYYLKWYGAPHRSAQQTCPATLALLARIPSIKAAMFSVLPPNSALSLHSDPLACSMRYHLGLRTPNSEHCYISVDGIRVHWKDGEDFVFDETYPHYVRNDSDQIRVILMCDVARPMNFAGRLFNRAYCRFARTLLVPNSHEDARGGASALFATVEPLLARGKTMKRTRPVLYRFTKLAINLALLTLLLAAFVALAEGAAMAAGLLWPA
jgi:beta-hydroxylase